MEGREVSADLRICRHFLRPQPPLVLFAEQVLVFGVFTWRMSLSLHKLENMLKLPLVAVAEGHSPVLGNAHIGLVRKGLQQCKCPCVARAGLEALALTDEGLLLDVDHNLRARVLFQQGVGGSGVVNVGVSDADVAEGVLLVGEYFIDGLEQGGDLHGGTRVDEEPVVSGVGALVEGVAANQEGGDGDVDAQSEGPDDGAAEQAWADFYEAVEVWKVVHCELVEWRMRNVWGDKGERMRLREKTVAEILKSCHCATSNVFARDDCGGKRSPFTQDEEGEGRAEGCVLLLLPSPSHILRNLAHSSILCVGLLLCPSFVQTPMVVVAVTVRCSSRCACLALCIKRCASNFFCRQLPKRVHITCASREEDRSIACAASDKLDAANQSPDVESKVSPGEKEERT